MSDIELTITARARHIDHFDVGRVLPAPARRMVGPFIFCDHIGPSVLPPGQGLDVRPHPHLHLATVTYLFEGEIFHRDSLGSAQAIRPGAINWMHAGRGIVHSERSAPEVRARGAALHGLQLWVALPQAHEDTEPAFSHYEASALPEADEPGVRLRVLAGSAYGLRSPVEVRSPLAYVEARLGAGARLEVPGDHEERALYVLTGEVDAGSSRIGARTMGVLRSGASVVVEAVSETTLAILSGAPLDGPRYVWWNFVSSSKERIEAAARDWREGRFPRVPGDEIEFIPLTEEPHFPQH